MKLVTKLKNLFASHKAVMTIATVGLVGAAVLVPLVKAEFYPNRPTYDYNKACDPNDGDKYDRCGSLEGPVFNSFVNTPSYGDERAFFDARRSDQTAAGSYKNVLPNVNEGSKEVVMRMYIHNNANQSTNASGQGIAHDTKVRVALPTATESVQRARAYISASNASMVEDTVDLTGTEKFKVSYKPGSAIIYNNGGLNGKAISDSVVTTGAPIGHNALDGNLPGCFEYEAVVQVTVTITPAPTPNLQMTKEVRKVGETEWKKEVQAKPGEVVQWKLATKNISNANLTDVTLRDVLPPHVQLVPGSVSLIDASQNTPQQDGPLFTNNGMITAQTQQPGGIRYVSFKTTVLGDFSECQARVRNVALARSTQTPETQDDADVVITKENCNTNPLFACEALATQQLSKNSYKFTATGTAQGATITGYIFSVDGNVVQDSASNEYTLNQATPGNHTVSVIVKTDKGNSTASAACTKTITVEDEPEEPVYNCDLLTLTQIGGRKVRLAVNATASGGATIQRYIFSFGDGSENLSTDKNVVEYEYNRDGTFNSSVQVVFNVNGQQQTVTGNQCTAAVKFVPKDCVNKPETPEDECNPCVDNPNTPANECKPCVDNMNTPVNECNPTTPGSLPETGPGSVVAIFVGVTAAGMALYNLMIRRFSL